LLDGLGWHVGQGGESLFCLAFAWL
jgi:hypothetical protein